MFDAVVERFLGRSPLTVMARLVLERACDAGWVDGLFEEARERQYQRELLFSEVVDRMGLVVLGLRPSLHAALQREPVGVSVQAFYKKVAHSEPGVLRALVQGSHARLSPLRQAVDALRPAGSARVPLCEGYRVRVVDTNDLPASDKRLKPLRGFAGAALPGQSLVVYAPEEDLVRDVLPWADAHDQETGLLHHLLQTLESDELWLADRAFSSRPILRAFAARGALCLIREQSSRPVPQQEGALRRVGRIETGEVYEQPVCIPDDAQPDGLLHLRRIELRLREPTEDGDTCLRLLTNVPARRKRATTLARLYQKRWTVEALFGRLEAALHSELRGLGQPHAALLAFCTALLAYNVLSVLMAAVEAAHADVVQQQPLSSFYVAAELREYYGGLKAAVAPEAWQPYATQSPQALAATLVGMAHRVNPAHLKKHPRAPKPKRKKRRVPHAQYLRQVATSRVMAAGTVDYVHR
ncbi:MAG TPA: transposase [Aggregicoccus sp.]|nr:transposase [Aggregicoccus sp.]